MDDAKYIKELSGHSGCGLALFQSQAKGFFVRKISRSKGYNSRLKAQYLRQKFFFHPIVRAPRILEHGFFDDKFYFDMEFIMGKTLATSIGTSSLITIRYLTQILSQYFHSTATFNAFVAPESFHLKISDLQTKIHASSITDAALNALDRFCWDHIPQSPCHGDLTLENILIQQTSKGVAVYLIDFLDSFCDTWLIDIAKILQDLELGWSFRNAAPDTTRSVRMLIAKEALLSELRKLPNSETLLITAYHLLILNVLRIYPYCCDEVTKSFLDNALQGLLRKFEYL